MKFRQLMEINMRIFYLFIYVFFKNHAENKAGKLVSDLFDFLKSYM